MEPVGQKSRFEAISPSTDGLSYEFLLKLLDLSRAETPGMKIIVSLPAALLTKAFDAASSLPVRFIMKASPLRNELEQLLGESSSGPVTLEVERDGNRLLWNFRGKNIALSLASPLILSRPLPILLEDPQPVPKPDLPSGGPETLLPTRTILAYSSPSQDEPLSRGGGALALSGAGILPSAGPVAVWPAFFPDRTIALSVRWIPEERRKDEEPSGRPGGEVVFSLEIPWGRGNGDRSPEKILLTGLWGEGGVTLQGRNLPEDFLKHFEGRREILSESLRVFPGVLFSARLSGRESGRMEEGEIGGSRPRK